MNKIITLIPIQSQSYALVLQTDSDQRLRHIYFGEKLQNPNDYALIAQQSRYNGINEDIFNVAHTPSGTWNIAEPALELRHADGNPSTELHYVRHSTEKMEENVVQTVIDLIDPLYQTQVQLYYKVFQKENVF
ncbi:MAG: glycoside hydrolase family 36 N-terminal domain-containing protein, partial [Chitinophagales bacterium]